MKKYFQVFKLGIHDALVYRARMVVWFLHSVMWILVLPFIWLSIYGENQTLAGYTKPMMLAYFFFIPLIESITYFHVEHEIQEDIKNGNIVNFTLRPLSYTLYQYIINQGYKCIGIFPPLLTICFLFPFVKNTLAFPTPSVQLLWIIPSVLLGGAVSFLISSLIGMVAFWTTRAEWATHLWWMISTFVGGFVGPLEFFPHSIQTIISYTPFSLFIHTPISILLEKIDTPHLLKQFWVGILWVIGLLIFNKVVYRRGIRRSEGIGI